MIDVLGVTASSHNLGTGSADGVIDSNGHLSSPAVAGGKTNNAALHELLSHAEQFEQYVANLSTVAGADGKDADENELNLRLRQLNRKLSMHISSSMKALITDEERIALLGMMNLRLLHPLTTHCQILHLPRTRPLITCLYTIP